MFLFQRSFYMATQFSRKKILKNVEKIYKLQIHILAFCWNFVQDVFASFKI